MFSIVSKKLLMTALCLSHLRFNVGTLGPLNARQLRNFATTYTRVARSCTGMMSNSESHFAHLAVLAKIGWVEPTTLILLDRMRYLKRFLCLAPAVAFALLDDMGFAKRC